MRSPRCVHQGAFTKVRSPRCVHQGAFTKVRSPRCVHQGAFTKVRSPRCVHQGAFTKVRSPRRIHQGAKARSPRRAGPRRAPAAHRAQNLRTRSLKPFRCAIVGFDLAKARRKLQHRKLKEAHFASVLAALQDTHLEKWVRFQQADPPLSH